MLISIHLLLFHRYCECSRGAKKYGSKAGKEHEENSCTFCHTVALTSKNLRLEK